jgi:hypothetical protein
MITKKTKEHGTLAESQHGRQVVDVEKKTCLKDESERPGTDDASSLLGSKPLM